MALVGLLRDAGALLLALLAVILIAVGMFGDVEGGNMKSNVWFPWHPVMMSISFPCLMTLGRYSYLTDPVLGLSKVSIQRQCHRAFMVLATLGMLAGYLCIFKAHYPTRKFFGYDFTAHKWNADWKRIAHGWLGYGVIVLVLAQAVMGLLKMQKLTEGVRTLTFHGNLGKGIILIALINIILAIRIWAWSQGLKVLLYITIIAAGVYGALIPRPSVSQAGEETPLAPSQMRILQQQA